MIQRKYFDIIKKHLSQKEFTIITGARQIGKTTLLRQLKEDLDKSGKPTLYINLERKSVLADLDKDPEHIFNYIPQVGAETFYVFIDEIQYLTDPTNFIKLLYDEYAPKIKIIATGSSAFYMDRNFKDSLAGRKKIFELKTLDFKEFLHFKSAEDVLRDINLMQNGSLRSSLLANQAWILMEEYLTYGGYPAVVLEDDNDIKIERLRELKDSFVKRDILEAGVEKEDVFYKLMILLSSQIGNLVNVNELANTLKVANTTVDNYLYIMQKCFHIGLVKPFYVNVRKELIKMPKVYFNDMGLRNVLLNNFQRLSLKIDKGSIIENLMYRKLIDHYPTDQVKFWRTADGNEVDFVVENTLESGFAFEIKYAETEVKIAKYKKFMTAYPNFSLSFVYWGQQELLY